MVHLRLGDTKKAENYIREGHFYCEINIFQSKIILFQCEIIFQLISPPRMRQN